MKVENKFFIDGKEVEIVAEKFGTKIYINDEKVYVANYDDVLATMDLDSFKLQILEAK